MQGPQVLSPVSTGEGGASMHPAFVIQLSGQCLWLIWLNRELDHAQPVDYQRNFRFGNPVWME